MKIESPSTGQVAEVERNRLNTNSVTQPELDFISDENEDAYSVVSHDATAAAGTYIVYFKNDDSTKQFHLDEVFVGGVASILWKLWQVTGTAAGGNALTPSNLNLKSGKTATATSRGDDSITGLSTSKEIASVRTAANDSGQMQLRGSVILGLNDAIAIEVDAAGSTDVAEVTFVGHYK